MLPVFVNLMALLIPLQIDRPLVHTPFQLVPIAAQLLVPGLDLGEHGVEGLGEIADLVVAVLVRPQRIVLALGDPSRGVAQVQDRQRDTALQPIRQQRGDGQRPEQHGRTDSRLSRNRTNGSTGPSGCSREPSCPASNVP